jgi:transposase
MGKERERKRHAESRAALVGVDAGKFHHVLVVCTSDGDNSKPLKFEVTRAGFEAAVAFIQEKAGGAPAAKVLVGIEFAGSCGATLAHFLAERGYQVVSIRPIDTKNHKRTAHRRAIKTDEKDAETILSLLAQGFWVFYPFRGPGYAALRHLVSAAERLTLQHSAAVTRLRWVLQVVFPEFEALFGPQGFTRQETAISILEAYPGPQAILDAPFEELRALVHRVSRGHSGEDFARRLVAAAEGTVAIHVASNLIGQEVCMLVAQIRLLRTQREKLEELVLGVLELLPEAGFLLGVPGVGPMTAAMFFGSLGDVRAYQTSRQALAMAGLGLTEKSSGRQLGVKRITKEGRAVMRRYMYLLVMRLITKKGPYRGRYEELRGRGMKHRPAVVAIARSLLKVMFAVAVKRESFDASKLGRLGIAKDAE